MNWHCPPYYTEPSVEESMKTTLDLLDHISKLPQSPAKEPLVHPIITPRFAISCTEELLTRLGELADTLPHVVIQTHISENQKEVQDAVELFQADSYAAIYEKFGLLRSNTILGHGVWLTEKEMELIAKHGAGVAHCPTSNFYLSSGMARVGMLLDYGVKVRPVSITWFRITYRTYRSALALMSVVATVLPSCTPSRWPVRPQRCCLSKQSQKRPATSTTAASEVTVINTVINTATRNTPSQRVCLHRPLQNQSRRQRVTASITVLAITPPGRRVNSPTKNLALRHSCILQPKVEQRCAVYRIVSGHSRKEKLSMPWLPVFGTRQETLLFGVTTYLVT
jgi:hypothetical protein